MVKSIGGFCHNGWILSIPRFGGVFGGAGRVCDFILEWELRSAGDGGGFYDAKR